MERPYPQVEGVQHRHVDVRGFRAHVAEAGAGDPVVLLHGWPQHWYAWRHLIPRLAESRRVICPDLRGLGWSEAPEGGYEKDELARDLLGVLDALEIERTALVAHDWGAFAGFLACLEAPERFDRYCAMSIVPPWYRPELNVKQMLAASYQYLLASPVGGQLVRRVPKLVETVYRRGSVRFVWSDEELAALVDPLRDAGPAHATVQIYRSFLLRDLPRMRAGEWADTRLVVPTLVLYGDGDLVIRDALWEDTDAHADDLRVEKIPDVGHFLPEEAPETVLAELLPFLDR